jgi:prophage antirepressor-like protein
VTPLRTVRIDDELWCVALAVARASDRTLSEVIRDLLAEWVAAHEVDSHVI